MTNPIKRFFQIIKAIVLLPVSFLQMRRGLQEIEKLRELPEDPEELRKLLAKMGVEDEMIPFFNPIMPQQVPNSKVTEVDLSYLDTLDEEEEEEEDSFDEELQ
ncbi:MAG: hypothetical protein HWN66_11250 [Candidatus Helarchaeota archaeon]|nr:hypothetical protein [Candidatus Helarchaeota archaeon]